MYVCGWRFDSTEMGCNSSTWLQEISSCSCLIFLPGPAWLLLNKICTICSLSLYNKYEWQGYIKAVQTWDKKWRLGCVNPASWPPLTTYLLKWRPHGGGRGVEKLPHFADEQYHNVNLGGLWGHDNLQTASKAWRLNLTKDLKSAISFTPVSMCMLPLWWPLTSDLNSVSSFSRWNMMEHDGTLSAWSVCFLIALIDDCWRRRRRRRRKTAYRPAGFAAGKNDFIPRRRRPMRTDRPACFAAGKNDLRCLSVVMWYDD